VKIRSVLVLTGLAIPQIFSCGRAAERGRVDDGGQGGVGHPAFEDAGAPAGSGGEEPDNAAGEGGAPPYGWSCDPRFPEPTGVCLCPNDLCRCEGAFSCARECGEGVTIEQLCISLDDIYLTACRCDGEE
jgi:hypothetical protein